MKNLKKEYIDYSLFKKYDLEYFKTNLIVPLTEDEISLSLAVCQDSKSDNIKQKFGKLIKIQKASNSDIRFVLSNLRIKIKLFDYALSIFRNLTINDITIEKFINKLLEFSISSRASDIHIEEFENKILFKFRIDGILRTFFVFDRGLFKQVSSYIKLISNLDITQNRLPLDSRFTQIVGDKKFNFRVSTMPTINSESIVLRILDNKNIDKSLSTLGLSSDLFQLLGEALNLTQGLILVTGPTGSGKTTTLYSMLKELNSDEKKIITVEDPVEYKIDSISQVSVNSKIGLDFDLILKNILRQDPDIIFIGEIRDKFSLEIALQASLTGHLVIASIHSSSAAQTITRLIDLQADPFLISNTLKLVVSQRLVLKYCKYCSSKGCKRCNFTLFYGRTCIAEVLKIDEYISSMIFKKAEINDIKKYLKSIEFRTLLDDGMQKVKDGITSKEEVYKVVNI